MGTNGYGYEGDNLKLKIKIFAIKAIDAWIENVKDTSTTNCPACRAVGKVNYSDSCGDCPLHKDAGTKVSGLCAAYLREHSTRRYKEDWSGIERWLRSQKTYVEGLKTRSHRKNRNKNKGKS